MPDEDTLKRAREDEREGKSPSTQAGEFVREEIHHIREGKHGARSAKQAVAIGLSKARRAGVKLGKPKRASKGVQHKAELDTKAGRRKSKPSPTRSRAIKRALKREGHESGSSTAMSRQTKAASRTRSRKDRSAAARKAARTRSRD